MMLKPLSDVCRALVLQGLGVLGSLLIYDIKADRFGGSGSNRAVDHEICCGSLRYQI